ncbi:hypothetical protein GOB57_21320 [Sinorhizobium meliloti]|nr:hypothetical protein [Sinorhizobium meliloti]
MRFTISSAAFAALFLASYGSSQAATKCYEDIPVPASLQCADNGSKSADFTTGCTYVPQSVQKKEIECPATARWVNANGKDSQAQVCSAAGLKSANIDGQICAAGEKRPSSGVNYQGINYRFGKWGGGGGEGGTIVERKKRRTSRIGDDKPATYETNYYCWKSSGTRDYDGTDIAVAYVCDEK